MTYWEKIVTLLSVFIFPPEDLAGAETFPGLLLPGPAQHADVMDHFWFTLLHKAFKIITSAPFQML